jgi:tetratricopeptide (TPR) repeat protein
MISRVLVERALALIPESDEFLPLADAVIGTSRFDQQKLWARSGGYTTLGKRVVDLAQVKAQIPDAARKTAERLERLFTLTVEAVEAQQAGNPAEAVRLLVEAGELEEAEHRLEKAGAIYQLALEVADDLREKRPQILALRRLGRIARAAARFNDAWNYYERSYNLATDEMDVPGQVIACQGLGTISNLRGMRARARAWFERGLTLARGLDDLNLLWQLHIGLSIPARQSGELDEADQLLDRALLYIESAGNEAALPTWYNGKGLVLQERGDYSGAELIYRDGLKRSPDSFAEMTLRINLGLSLIPLGRLFEAEEEARKAEELAILNRFVPDLVDVYDLLGSLARVRRDEDGFVFYEQALEVCRERELPAVSEAMIYFGYGRLHLACGREREGVAYLDQARETYQRLGLTPELNRVLQELAGAAPAAAV